MYCEDWNTHPQKGRQTGCREVKYYWLQNQTQDKQATVQCFVSGIRNRQVESWIIAAFLAMKLAYEQLLGPLPGSEGTAGGEVVVVAHLYGAISGALIGTGLCFRKASQVPI